MVVDITMHYQQYPQLNLNEDPEEQERKEIYGEIMDQWVTDAFRRKLFNRLAENDFWNGLDWFTDIPSRVEND